MIRLFILFAAFAYSTQTIGQTMYETCPLKEGMEIPRDIEILNTKGESDKLEVIIGETPTVVIFYRGAW